MLNTQPSLIFDKWPDILEVFEDEETETVMLKFVMQRKNSRSFTSDQQMMLTALERAGLNVCVRVGTMDLSLDQFNRGNFALSKVSTISRQALYNRKSELNHAVKILEQLEPQDPRREQVLNRINRLKVVLGEVPSYTQESQSDQELTEKVIPALKQATVKEKENRVRYEAAEQLRLENEISDATRNVAELEQAVKAFSLDSPQKSEFISKLNTAKTVLEQAQGQLDKFRRRNDKP